MARDTGSQEKDSAQKAPKQRNWVRALAAILLCGIGFLLARAPLFRETTVIVDAFEEGARLTRISATIYCEREGQKGILIGKKGQMLKRIGTSARLQIERMLGMKVFLELYVKVQPDWRESRAFVEELDWRRQLENLTDGRAEPAEPSSQRKTGKKKKRGVLS